MILPSLLLFTAKAQLNSDLDAISRANESIKSLPWSEQFPKREANHEKVMSLINANVLKSAEDYRVASENLLAFGNDYENTRVQYELLYTASVLGDEPSKKRLASTWDTLMLSLGRKRPMDAVKDVSQMHGSEAWRPQLTASCIRKVWMGDTSSKTATDNPEIAKMFKADQEVRQGEMNQEAISKMIREDMERMKRIRQMVAKNMLRTANDFHDAAFLYQHGSSFDDYQMAHQLAVCSVLLGRKNAKWIGAASYDRMLKSIGHKQRWATQYRMAESKWILQAVDSDGICDNQRQQVVGKTLAQAQAFQGN